MAQGCSLPCWRRPDVATYAIYIKDLPGGGIEVHRDLVSGVHGARSEAALMAVRATEQIKQWIKDDDGAVQSMSSTTIVAPFPLNRQ